MRAQAQYAHETSGGKGAKVFLIKSKSNTNSISMCLKYY